MGAGFTGGGFYPKNFCLYFALQTTISFKAILEYALFGPVLQRFEWMIFGVDLLEVVDGDMGINLGGF
jgi:hypothetical protein